MEIVVREALRLWLRGGRDPDVVELVELLKIELQRRDIRLELPVDDRAPEQGPGK